MNILYKKLFFSSMSCLLFICIIIVDLEALEKEHVNIQRTKFNDVINKAKSLAENPYLVDNKNIFPDFLKKLSYDEWRNIRFRPNRSLGGRDPFKVQFFHLGFIYQEPVSINYYDQTGMHRMIFASDLFDYKNKQYFNKLTKDIGFAGFRIHYPLNTPLYDDELVAFLGASYFRALGKNMRYGISARGLAINTVENTGEEFPYFKEFWIMYSPSLSKEITIYALLDSKSLTGAYEFILNPGEETIIHVKSILFIRKEVKKIGVAPLTSMFLHGENSGIIKENDFRPEVHDSDGLLINNKSLEWTWHPIINPDKLTINSFAGGQPLGFGLLQRDINFDHYQDLEARYDLRPSVWITPEGDWGDGHLELIQIPTENEYNDNIVMYWAPEKALKVGDSLSFSYTLSWYSAKYKKSSLAVIEATRIVRKDKSIMFFIDFVPRLRNDFIFKKEITADINEFNGYKIIESQIINNTVTGGLRLVIKVSLDKEGFFEGIIPNDIPPIELRAFLKDKNIQVTETWSYTYLP